MIAGSEVGQPSGRESLSRPPDRPGFRETTVKRLPSSSAFVVLAVVVALSVLAWWVVHNGIAKQERALLRQQTAQVVLVLQTNLNRTSLGLGSIGAEKATFDKQAGALQTLPTNTVMQVTMGQVTGPKGQVTPGPPQVHYAVGPLVPGGSVLTGDLANIAMNAAPTLSASPVIRIAGKPYVVYSIVPPSIALPGYVAMEAVQIFPSTPITTPPGTFRQLRVAMYATPTPRPDQLILSSTGKPLMGKASVQQMRLDRVDWAVVGVADGSLLTVWTEATPWIVLGVGLLLAIGLGLTVETLSRRQRWQRGVAETLQEALLPDTLPQREGTEALVRYLPGVEGIHVGGDWYDLITLDDGNLLAVVGDVSGRGLGAASVMTTLLHAIQAYAADGQAPEVILGKLSVVLSLKRYRAYFATVLLILIDLQEQNITVVNAGHPPPLLVDDLQSQYLNSPIGPPVGVSSTGTYTPVTVPISPGTTLLAFTDGLIERRGENLDEGLERLREAAIAGAGSPLQDLLSGVLASLIGKGTEDDTVLLGIRWTR